MAGENCVDLYTPKTSPYTPKVSPYTEICRAPFVDYEFMDDTAYEFMDGVNFQFVGD